MTFINKTYFLETINEHLERNDFLPIINDKKLFKIAFYKSIGNKSIDNLKIKLCDNTLQIAGYLGRIRRINKILEIIRIHCIESIDEKQIITIVLISFASDYIFKKFNGGIISKNLDNNNDSEYKLFYNQYIKPYLVNFGKIIKINFEMTKQPILIKLMTNVISSKMIKSIKISSISSPVYPIPPISMTQHDTSQSFYEMYKNNKFCDMQLKTQDKTFNIHANILYANSSQVIQNMLDNNMTESINKCIQFNTFSNDTIQAFIEYIYLGSQCVFDKIYENKLEVNLCELLHFSNMYELKELSNCTINLLILFCDDVDTIREIIKTDNHEQLAKLYEHLSK